MYKLGLQNISLEKISFLHKMSKCIQHLQSNTIMKKKSWDHQCSIETSIYRLPFECSNHCTATAWMLNGPEKEYKFNFPCSHKHAHIHAVIP